MENVKTQSHYSEVHYPMEGNDKFDKIAEVYDTNVRKQLPQYDELRKVFFESIPFPNDSKINVLELGVGTGTTAAELLELYPNARLIGVDISSKMIEQSRHKLDQYKSRTELVNTDFKTLPTMVPLDLIYSILTVHHVPSEDKEALFSKIHTILQPGGVFILMDFVKGASDQITKHSQNNAFSHIGEGRASSIMEYIELLQKAGFKTIDVAWKRDHIACLIALKTH
jgi:ubiquinone/menaquinone biosynthesis C-methylase UbiE